MFSSFATSSFLLACLTLAQTSPKLDPVTSHQVCSAVELFAETQHFEPELIAAMGWVESRFNPAAVSRSGARGVMQVILGKRWSPAYSAEDMLDPWLSVEAGVLMALRWRDERGAIWLDCYNTGTRCRKGAYRRSVSSVMSDIVKSRRSYERGHSVAWGDR